MGANSAIVVRTASFFAASIAFPIGGNYGAAGGNYGAAGGNYGAAGGNYGAVDGNYGAVGDKEGSGASKNSRSAVQEVPVIHRASALVKRVLEVPRAPLFLGESCGAFAKAVKMY